MLRKDVDLSHKVTVNVTCECGCGLKVLSVDDDGHGNLSVIVDTCEVCRLEAARNAADAYDRRTRARWRGACPGVDE